MKLKQSIDHPSGHSLPIWGKPSMNEDTTDCHEWECIISNNFNSKLSNYIQIITTYILEVSIPNFSQLLVSLNNSLKIVITFFKKIVFVKPFKLKNKCTLHII